MGMGLGLQGKYIQDTHLLHPLLPPGTHHHLQHWATCTHGPTMHPCGLGTTHVDTHPDAPVSAPLPTAQQDNTSVLKHKQVT